jgi:hypothetical protein
VGYRRHVDRKTKEGSSHPDRDAQFEYFNAKAGECLAAGHPVVSVDTKKKELLGEFKNAGSDYGPKDKPVEVDTHDFENKQLGKVFHTGYTTSSPTRAMSASASTTTRHSLPSTPCGCG